MKIVIAILIILLVFLGFQFYNIVDREITEASISQIQVIETDEIKNVAVDNINDLTSYSQRISTYEPASDNLIKASTHYIDELDPDYTHIFLFNDDTLLHKEFSDDSIDLGSIHKEILLVLNSETPIETNIDSKGLTFYDLNGLYLIHIKPIQTGKYQLSYDNVTIHFENMER